MEKYTCRYCLNFSPKRQKLLGGFWTRFFDEKYKTCVCSECVSKFYADFIFIKHGPPIPERELPAYFLIRTERNYNNVDIQIQWKDNAFNL